MMRNASRDERGSAATFVVGIAITLVVVAGLVVDGGGALNARQRIADDAEAAAVAGAQATDLTILHTEHRIVVDRAAAAERAAAVLAGRGYDDFAVSFNDDLTAVTVVARDTVPTQMLLLIGIDQFEIRAEATAEAEVL